MQGQLRGLQNLTQMALDAEMIKLRQISQAEQAIADQIKALDALGDQRAEQLVDNGGADVALYAGADRRWAKWKQQQKIALNTQRAQLLAKRDVQKSATLKTFGKDQAVRRLLDRAKEAAMLKQRRL